MDDVIIFKGISKGEHKVKNKKAHEIFILII